MNELKENAEFWNAKAKFYARKAPMIQVYLIINQLLKAIIKI